MGAPVTLANIREAVRERGKVDESDTFILDSIDSFINQRYLNIATEQKWRWLIEQRDIKIEDAYTTGTVDVTNDSRTLTGTATAWTTNMVGRHLTIAGDDTIYEVISRPSATSIQLSERVQRATGTGLAYNMFQSEYGLWPDLDYIDEVWHDSRPREVTVKPLGYSEYIQKSALDPNRSGKADFYTKEGVAPYEGVPIGEFVIGHDFIGQPDSYKLALYPLIADADYVLHVTYVRRVDPLINDSDEPLIPKMDRWILVYGALADFYDQQGNETSMQFWNNEFDKGLKRMMRDYHDTDDKARLVVQDKWRRDSRRLSPSRWDLGTFFDAYYTRRR